MADVFGFDVRTDETIPPHEVRFVGPKGIVGRMTLAADDCGVVGTTTLPPLRADDVAMADHITRSAVVDPVTTGDWLRDHARRAVRARERAMLNNLTRYVGAPVRVLRIDFSGDLVAYVFDVEVARMTEWEIHATCSSEADVLAAVAMRARAGWLAYPGEPVPDNVTLGSD